MQEMVRYVLSQIVPGFIGFKYGDDEYIMSKDYRLRFECGQPVIGFGFYMDKNKVKMLHFEVHSSRKIFAILEEEYLIEGKW